MLKAKADDVFFDILNLQKEKWELLPRWRSSLTSVNTYLLQAVNYVEYFANSGGKSTACFGTSGTLAPSGQKAEALKAYNMTVDKDHTYFIKGAKADNEGVWVHNDCWHALPNGAKQVASIDGYKAYQFTDPKDGKVVTVVQKDLNRFETPSHQHGIDPHFNRLSQQIDAETGRYLSTDNPVDGLYNRSYLRSETLQKIYANYEKTDDGGYWDIANNKKIEGPIDIGHIYGWEHRSHKNEMPGKGDILDIKKDMQNFMNRGK